MRRTLLNEKVYNEEMRRFGKLIFSNINNNIFVVMGKVIRCKTYINLRPKKGQSR